MSILVPDKMKTRMERTKSLFGILSITAALGMQLQAQSFLTNGLVAYYRFNGNANDASGNGNNGTLVGTDLQFLIDRFGQQQSALFINSTSTIAWNVNGPHVDAPRATGFDLNTNFTMSVWLNISHNLPDNGEATEVPMEIGNDNDYGFSILLMARNVYGGQDHWSLGWQGGADIAFYLPIMRDVWWQLTVIRSGGNLSVFKNGSFLTTAVITGPAVNGPTVRFGESTRGGSNRVSWWRWVGGIDDCRFYSRALSTNEVQQLYAIESREPRVDLIKAVRPSFSNLYLGTKYKPQASTDLIAWYDQGPPFTATTTEMEYPMYYDVDFWNQLYFRLQVVP
jgi:hypothetical protein